MPLRRLRPIIAAAAIAVTAMALAACAPSATPTPTPTPHFTSEAQAFKAAEDTYRAYVDATNAVDLSNPKTFEPVYKWTSGDNLGAEKKSLTEMYSKRWVVTGKAVIRSFIGESFTPNTDPRVGASVCLDVSDVRVVDAAGESQVSPDRQDRYGLKVKFTESSATSTGLTVSKITAVEDPSCSG